MKTGLTLLDCLRQVIDFAEADRNSKTQAVLYALLKDVAKAVEAQRMLSPANVDSRSFQSQH